MQSPVPFITEELTNNSPYASFSLTPPIPPAAVGKRRPPAPPSTTGSWQLDEKLPACGAGATMTIFGGTNRGGHLAGAGHAAAGMVRRATAPTAPQYLDASLTPPPSSASPADRIPASREGTRQSFYEGPPPIERRTSTAFESDARRSSTGFSGLRRSVTGDMYAPQSRGGIGVCGDTIDEIKDENRILREELSRLQNSQLDSLHRRPMAAIAGGGFRGPSSTQTKSACMCDSLRSKLAKIRQELREARGEQRLPSRGGFPMEVRDNEAQTSPKSSQSVQVLGSQNLYKPPQTAPSTFSGAARALAARSSSPVDVLTQTDSTSTADASSQAFVSICQAEAEAQTVLPKGEEQETQAGNGISDPREMETQTAPPVMLRDSGAQAEPTEAAEVAVQAGEAPAMSLETAAQTEEALPTRAAGVDSSVQCIAEATATAAQTDAPQAADGSCQVDFPQEPKLIDMCSAASQTTAPARSVAAVQTTKAKAVTVATQAAPPAGIDRGCQAEDKSLEEAMMRIAQGEARIEELEARLAAMSLENEALAADKIKAEESAKAFQAMAQTKAFGQMNVTILCPRAECTVSGERVEMDSWNPQRLREEFEREVLPRFTRVFVEETQEGKGPKGGKARSEAVDRAMQDFAETFRERLSAMLSAPNAAAAVQAAAAAKGTAR